ncbi:MAG: efflux RND transporter periplasmic adaptor subunit [Phycisphaerales bacterium]
MRIIRLAHHRTPAPRGCRFVIALACLGAITALTLGAGSEQPGERRRVSSPDPFPGYRAEGYPAIAYPSRAMALSFTRPGVIAEIPVEENARVVKNEVLVRLKSDVQQHVVEVQRLAAENELAIETAEARLDLAEFDLNSQLEASQRDATSPRELERARIEHTVRRIELDDAKRVHLQAKAAYERELAVLDEMTLKSPIDGHVIRIDHEVGEAVDGLEPVVRVVQIDPLWLDVEVPVALGMRIEPESSAVIHWRDLTDHPPFDARVVFVSPVVDSEANRIVVRVEVDNPDEIPAGLHATVQFPEAQEAFLAAKP